LHAALYNWPSPFDPMIDRIRSWSDKRVVILATGDPMNYGVGALLAPRLRQELKIIPTPSAFSLAAARMGWSLPEVEMLSLHGRDASLLDPMIYPRARILALTEGDLTVRAAAERLKQRDYGASRITVMEHMGGSLERQTAFQAMEAPSQTFSGLSTIAIECVAQPGARFLPRVPGLPDDAYAHDGQITKRETRAITLAALGPTPSALLWDIGAGCGSISIEWMRIARNARAIAVEPDKTRRDLIATNAQSLGTPELAVIAGRAPEALEGLPCPDAVFIGGAVSQARIVEHAWNVLAAGGRLVANAVTLEGRSALIDYQKSYGGDLVTIDISHLAAIGDKRSMRPQLSVMQWRALKS
jgi:precorrin-6Y C5,15-methyltransferase (decarboxylating)